MDKIRCDGTELECFVREGVLVPDKTFLLQEPQSSPHLPEAKSENEFAL
jgi:hypothetical protein